MEKSMVIPAQIRAGRALLGWTQEHLAEMAKISVSTVRDFEAMRRSDEVGGAVAMRRALENSGVIFIAGVGDDGPGVRLVGARPNIIRRPTTMSPYDELPFWIEWRGRRVIVFLSREVLEDLAEGGHCRTDAEYVAAFDRNLAYILTVAARTIDTDPRRVTPNEQLHLDDRDFSDRRPSEVTRLR